MVVICSQLDTIHSKHHEIITLLECEISFISSYLSLTGALYAAAIHKLHSV